VVGTNLSMKKVGIIIPTLGERQEYLLECINSIRRAGEVHLQLVVPKNKLNKLSESLINKLDQVVEDPGEGLPAAINKGVEALPNEIIYFNWLGDDDLLEQNTVSLVQLALDENPSRHYAYGGCRYIDSHGQQVGINKSGNWARRILAFGPDLVPQPGALIRRGSFHEIGGLDESLRAAFDFDLFLRLEKLGGGIFLKIVLGSFRWHKDSISVQQRRKSVLEASEVRRKHLPMYLNYLSWLWEGPVALATFLAGYLVSFKLYLATIRTNR
jgi:GT2 family glycosyltransferase